MTAPRILILYNSRSAHKRVNFSAYLKELADLGAHAETRLISHAFNLKELLADAKNFDRIVVAGGDGTVSTVAGLLQNTGVPIVAYPGGTANLLARNLRIPSNPKALAEVTLNGRPVETDLGELEYVPYSRRESLKRRFLKRQPPAPKKIYFSIIAGCGFAAHLMSQAMPLKSWLGEAAYWVSAFLNLYPRRARFYLRLDGQEVRVKGIGILIINFEKIQFDIKVTHGSHAGDGKFEVMIVKARSLFGLIPLLWSGICERLGMKRWRVPEIEDTYRATDIEIESDLALKLQFDGELLKKAKRFKIRACPGATMFVYGDPVAVSSPPV